MPNDGHNLLNGQAPHAGLREWHTLRPCQINRCERLVLSFSGINSATANSTFTGSFSLLLPFFYYLTNRI